MNKRRKHKKRKKYVRNMRKTLLFSIAGTVVILGILAVVVSLSRSKDVEEIPKNPDTLEAGTVPAEEETAARVEEEQAQKRTNLIAEANLLAAGYDYDGAIEKLKSYEGYENYSELTEAIAGYEATKATCVPVNIEEVTHVFYHSLVVDPERCFANQETDRQARGNNQWMTTIEEFNKITQSMYEKGYVLVSLYDMVTETVDENGTVHFSPGTIMLPPDKKAFVLSLDDLSYYHSYDNYGYASKMVLDENGKPTCEYIQPDGTVVTGGYDVVPLMDQFIEEHPDAAYKGARGTIALTGYNGVLGYRTDISYQTVPEDINADKKKWLEEHPEFNLETERAEAKKVADALKAEGWTFASHTWGHLKVGEISLERLQNDTIKWKENVEPIVGATDTIIFAHGSDLAGWVEGYTSDNEKFNYLKSQGFNYFCNVDSRQYGVQIKDNYVRQTRRNLDGYRIYYNAIGEMDSLSDLFDAAEIMDPKRPPVYPLS